MTKSSRKISRRTRKTRRGGAWYNPFSWFGSNQEEVVAPTGTSVTEMSDGVESYAPAAGPVGGRHRRGRRHRKTRRAH